MKNILAILFLIFSSIGFAQYTPTSMQVPSFDRIDNKSDYITALNKLNINIQNYIANSVSKTFIKKYFKPNDSIEFNFNLIINRTGLVQDIKVNTEVEVFNNEVNRVLLLLPKFKPGEALIVHEPQDFYLTYTPEYYITENYNLKPILRINIDKYLNFNTGESALIDTAKKLGYDISKHKIYGDMKFSLSANGKIEDLYFESPHVNFNIMMKRTIENHEDSGTSIFANLKTNTNYHVRLAIVLSTTFGEYSLLNDFLKDSDIKIPKPDLEIESVVTFPGCETHIGNNERRICNSKKINAVIARHFNPNIATKLNLSGNLKIILYFDVNEEGSVENIKSRSPHPKLDEEAKRVIKLFPIFKPASRNGKSVKVSFNLPITINN